MRRSRASICTQASWRGQGTRDRLERLCRYTLLRLMALIEQTRIVEPVLRHLGLPTGRPAAAATGAAAW